MEETSRDLKIRPIGRNDLDAVVEIDMRVLGEKRTEYWDRKLVLIDGRVSHGLVAESDGKVIGFILGNISGLGFGIHETVGWIETVGIDPGFQGGGIASSLARHLIVTLKALGVKTVYTLVHWDEWDLLQFFHKIGFTRGDMINLELKI